MRTRINVVSDFSSDTQREHEKGSKGCKVAKKKKHLNRVLLEQINLGKENNGFLI